MHYSHRSVRNHVKARQDANLFRCCGKQLDPCRLRPLTQDGMYCILIVATSWQSWPFTPIAERQAWASTIGRSHITSLGSPIVEQSLSISYPISAV